MALTRPRFGQLNTSTVAEADPITVLNQGSSSANVDVGFLFNRANGLVSNVALYWSESAQSIVTAYTANTGATNSNITVSSYANLTVGNVLTVNGGIIGIVGNLTLGNLISNTGVYAVSSVTSGDAYVGGNLTVVGNITTLNREIVTSVEIVSGNLVANSGTASTNTTTGALVVQGGAGISGALNVGGNSIAPSVYIAGGTNLLRYSQQPDFGNPWTLSSVTAAGNTAVAPDGTTTAATITMSAGTGITKYYYQNPNIVPVYYTYTGSIYIKANAANPENTVVIRISDNTTSNNAWSTFNISSGTYSTTGTAGSVYSGYGNIVAAANGWYRCSSTVTFTQPMAGTLFSVFGNGYGATSSTGSFYVWGAQVEPGSTATTYVPTTSSAIQTPNYLYATGANIVGPVNFTGPASTSTNTGALIVAGGAGISGNAIIGGNITTSTSLIPSGNVLSLGGNVSLDVLRIYSNNSVTSDYYNTTFTSPQFALVPPQNQYGAAIVQLGQNPRISSLGVDGIYVTTNGTLGYAGTTQLKIVHTGSAVNYTEITGGTTGNGPTIRAQGETNVELNLVSRGTSGINLRTGANTATQFRVGDTAGAVNYIQVIGSTTGTPPVISSQGSDGSLGMKVQWKGTGNFFLQSGSGSYNQLKINGANAAVNNLIITGTTAGNAPSLSVEGSDTNIDINLTPKGTGNVTTASPLTVTNANVSTSISTGALIVSGGAGISGNVFSGGNIFSSGYLQSTATTISDAGSNSFPVALLIPGNTWGIYANAAGGFYRQVIGKDSSNNILLGHTSASSSNGNINVNPGSNANNGFNVLNPVTAVPIFTVNATANTVVVANAQASTSNVTGALQVAGGVGVGGNINASGNIYALGTNSRHGYTWANSVSSVYTVFNSSTNSIDTVFG